MKQNRPVIEGRGSQLVQGRWRPGLSHWHCNDSDMCSKTREKTPASKSQGKPIPSYSPSSLLTIGSPDRGFGSMSFTASHPFTNGLSPEYIQGLKVYGSSTCCGWTKYPLRTTLTPWLKPLCVGICRGIIIPVVSQVMREFVHPRYDLTFWLNISFSPPRFPFRVPHIHDFMFGLKGC